MGLSFFILYRRHSKRQLIGELRAHILALVDSLKSGQQDAIGYILVMRSRSAVEVGHSVNCNEGLPKHHVIVRKRHLILQQLTNLGGR